MRRLAVLALALAAAQPSAARPVEAEGVANITAGDVAGARSRAIADALEQAVAQGGLTIDARSEMMNGVVSSDRMSTAATGHLLGHRILSETRERDLYRVAVMADVAAEAPRGCAASARPPLHLLAIAIDADDALDPAVAQPLAARIAGALADALGQAGVAVASASPYVGPPGDPRRSSVRYDALFTPDPLPTAGRLLAGTLRLERVVVPHTPLTGAPGEKLSATLVLDVIDAGTRRPLARVAARRDYRLTGTLLDLLPLGFQPPQPLNAPDLASLTADAARRIAAFGGCGPLSVAIVGRDRAGVTLGAGTADGVVPGDMLRIGTGEPLSSDGGWTVVEVTGATARRATARPVDPSAMARVSSYNAATKLP